MTVSLPVTLLDNGILFDGQYFLSDPSSLLLLGFGFMGLGHIVRRRLLPANGPAEPQLSKRRGRRGARGPAIAPKSAQVPGD